MACLRRPCDPGGHRTAGDRQVRCRQRRIESVQEVTLTWGGEMTGGHGHGERDDLEYSGLDTNRRLPNMVFAKDRGQATRRAF